MNKLAIILSHPIQHFCPLFESWTKNKNWKLKVFFACDYGAKKYYDESFKQMVSWPNLRLNSFDHKFLNINFNGKIDYSLDSSSLEEELSLFNPTIILTFGYIQKIQRRTKSYANSNGIPLLYFSDSELRRKRGAIKKILKGRFVTNYFKNISYFLVNGNANEEYYLNYNVPATKFIKCSYPIDINLYNNFWHQKKSLSPILKRKYAIKENTIILSVVGKLIDRKRQIDIIRALRKIVKLHFTLFIIGTGVNMKQWQEESLDIPNHDIHFTGFINPDILPEYYLITDIYVHPASEEAHSVAISEALSLGCATIISDRCGSYGTNDDVQIGLNGLVYESENTEHLKECLIKLGGNSELLEQFKIRSREISEQFQNNTHNEVLNTVLTLLG